MKKLIFFLILFEYFGFTDEFKFLWSSYTTYFKENIDQRKINITVAARYLDGFILLPKTIFSFNEEITDKIPENELGVANVFIGERRMPGFGGGLCQVSSTLYAAALYAGLSIFERRPHSKIVSYILPGLDATVSKEEGVDLKIYNPYKCKLIIRANVNLNSLNISIYGERPKIRDIKIILSRPERIDNFIYVTTIRKVFSNNREIFSEIVSRDKYYP
jgi:vancomycin resistance protein YoaR